MYLLRIAILFTALFSFTFSDNNASQSERSYIDDTHKTVSDKILLWTDDLDTMLSGWLGDNESNRTTTSERKASVRPPNKRVKSVDSFFQNKKYLDETDETFVTLRMDSEFNSLESDDFKVKLGGQISLSKSKNRFKFFIDNATSDNVDNILEEDASNTPELGFHYFAPETYGIE